MDWLRIFQTFWPVAATLVSLASLAVLLWLRTQFPTKAELKSTKDEIVARIEKHQDRLDTGSEKLAELDKRVAVVEEDCDSQPSKSDLAHQQAVLAGRMSGVESAVRGVERQVGTGNELLQILIQQGLK